MGRRALWAWLRGELVQHLEADSSTPSEVRSCLVCSAMVSPGGIEEPGRSELSPAVPRAPKTMPGIPQAFLNTCQMHGHQEGKIPQCHKCALQNPKP